ncbi:MAG TPA: outer membrane lipoprotein-sorting protein [Verrucomicrobia bacterium]|nr:outer membrane lipoprotein-sorting protein [Verrucomicrobiota bacterium]HOB31825.1 outer membrane lipoprotein-sorting protein [Verrucomicrobiota bacterium]HOP95819.1 outer membrane lipoprotein-sorting protein [Verrucomicrobiota bacterium]HPU57793.1 outer membrane lipoprotein-sorting protein [Verrucomicrobiota bacterium]
MNRLLAFLGLLCVAPLFLSASQPIVLSPAQAAKQGPELAAKILAAARPFENITNLAVIEVRRSRNKSVRPVQFRTDAGDFRWTITYETLDNTNAMKLDVTRGVAGTTEYRLRNEGGSEPRILQGNETMVPFADSDFWVADLGLQFLEWPEQRLLRKEIRRGQSCAVLESINPHPAPGAYTRVVSWVDIDTSGIINADAFEGDRLLKRFSASSFKKIDGQWELKEIVMENRRTGSVTRIEFDLKSRR